MSSPGFVLWKSAFAQSIAARIAIAGDFLPAGQLAVPSGGWRGAASGLSPYFSSVNVSFVNLESTLDAETLPFRAVSGLGQVVTSPASCLDYLEAIRCQPVGTANNHSYDYHDAGAQRTRNQLSRRGMIPLGAGRTLCDAPETFLWYGPNGIRVGFWAAAHASRELAGRSTRGVEPATLVRASQAIAAMKLRGAQFCTALLHVGCLRTNRADPGDIVLMDSIARCGFNVVAASHSHRIGGARLFDAGHESPSACFYGLGSIASGFIASPLEREGLIVIVCLNARGHIAQLEVRPVLLADSGFGEVPTSKTSATTILDRFHNLSEEIMDGSSKRLFYDDMSRGLMQLYLKDARAAFRHTGFRGLARKACRVRMSHVRRLVHRVIA